jgi:hypothetical protein
MKLFAFFCLFSILFTSKLSFGFKVLFESLEAGGGPAFLPVYGGIEENLMLFTKSGFSNGKSTRQTSSFYWLFMLEVKGIYIGFLGNVDFDLTFLLLSRA